MKPYLVVWQLARVVAVVLAALVLALALMHSRRGEQALILAPLACDKADGPVGEPARCRSVRNGETEMLESCRGIWAENRQCAIATSRPSQQALGVAPDAVASSGSRVGDLPPTATEYVGGR